MNKLQYLCAFALLCNNNIIMPNELDKGTDTSSIQHDNLTTESTYFSNFSGYIPNWFTHNSTDTVINDTASTSLSFASLTAREKKLNTAKNKMKTQHKNELDNHEKAKVTKVTYYQNEKNKEENRFNNMMKRRNSLHETSQKEGKDVLDEEELREQDDNFKLKNIELKNKHNEALKNLDIQHEDDINKLKIEFTKLKSKQQQKLNNYSIDEQQLKNDFAAGTIQAFKNQQTFLQKRKADHLENRENNTPNLKSYEHIVEPDGFIINGFELFATEQETTCSTCLDKKGYLRSYVENNAKISPETKEFLLFTIKNMQEQGKIDQAGGAATINGREVRIQGKDIRIFISNEATSNDEAYEEAWIESTKADEEHQKLVDTGWEQWAQEQQQINNSNITSDKADEAALVPTQKQQ